MPTLEWIGKDKVINHHQAVPYRVLKRVYSFDEQGQHEEDNGSRNMIIHGDNLEALKSLLPRYEGKVKCIYIDPPYNTGNEGWVYNDNVNDPKIKKWLGEVVGKEGEDLSRHDKWLCMMYPRLRLLQKLLRDDGVMAISISYHELHNLLLICREIFATRQVVPITVQTSGGKPSAGFNYSHEYVIFVCPAEFAPNFSSEAQNSYASPFHGMNLATFNQTQRPNQTYPIYIEKSTGIVIGVGKSLQQRIADGDYGGDKADFVFDYDEAPEGAVAVWPVTQKGDACVWRLIPNRLLNDWEKGYIKVVPQKKGKNAFAVQFLAKGIIQKIENGELKAIRESDNPDIPTLRIEDFKTGGTTIPTIWTDKNYYNAKGGDEITSILGKRGKFQYPKPTKLIVDIINRIAGKDDIVLDSFAGSGTTAHAVLLDNYISGNNRRFILIELGDYADEITAERAKQVICGNQNVQGTGGNFSYFELGDALLTEDEDINEHAGAENIRKYIWYMETHQEWQGIDNGNPYYLGAVNHAAYYFYYVPDKVTVLNHDFLATIPEKKETTVIYADRCTLSESTLTKYGIVFKKIPRDIAKL
ncbi:MAG: site-specific DNA-methyltransferase [Akkermansia sp.]|nr:site-specific DNA-methyltransferase [Akkermansia sp.]